jgi:thioredoxin reductase (NADPH)
MTVTETSREGAPVASKPVVLAVDDDPQVLAAVARDLRRQYGERFRIVRADSGPAGAMVLDELKLAAAPLALVVADQRMPALTGTELLTKSRELFPEARRVLLTAYADTDAAIAAINEVRLHHYILKPWDPPEERLYPVLDELLDEWEADYHPPFVGVRVVGHRFSPESHRLRDFLSRNLVPHRWLDVERDEHEAAQLRAAAAVDGLPLVVLADGTHQVDPTNRELAAAVGLRTASEVDVADLLVVGCGPAGLAAAVYGASEGLRTLVLERVAPGGQAGMSSRIENYLGFPNGVTGAELTRRALDQAKRLGAEVLSPTDVTELRAQDDYRLVVLDDGTTVASRSVIVATGVSYRTLDADGAAALVGRGVFYGASMHDARSFEGEDVALVGGANSAGQAALHFARYARRVTMLVRGPSLAASMSTYLIEQIAQTENVEVRFGSTVAAVIGDERLETVCVAEGGTVAEMPFAGLFVFIGAQPRTEWLAEAVPRDSHGFVLVGPDVPRERWRHARAPFSLETGLAGVFAAGDVRAGSVKRVASAVGDGALAVHLVHRYLGG